jgi:simple sugar transport system permease protein
MKAMMISGAIGGIAGCIEVLGVHGYFLNNFAAGLGNNGMLAALIAKNNIVTAPIIAFFIAVLKSGAMGMQQATSVPKSLVDTITAVFIIFACMELVGAFKKSKKKDDKKA